MGASVRGAIDLVRLLDGLLRAARRADRRADGRATRRRRDRRAVRPAAARRGQRATPEAVSRDPGRALAPEGAPPPGRARRPSRPRRPGKADGPPRRRAGSATRCAADRPPARGRREPAGASSPRPRQLDQVSPAVGRLDEPAFNELLRADPDAAVALIADLRRHRPRAARAARGSRPGCSCARAVGRRRAQRYRRLVAPAAARATSTSTARSSGGRRPAATRRRPRRPPLGRAAARALPGRPQRLDAGPRRRPRRHGRGGRRRPDAQRARLLQRSSPSPRMALVLQRQGESSAPAAGLVERPAVSLRGRGRTDLALAPAHRPPPELARAWARASGWPSCCSGLPAPPRAAIRWPRRADSTASTCSAPAISPRGGRVRARALARRARGEARMVRSVRDIAPALTDLLA